MVCGYQLSDTEKSLDNPFLLRGSAVSAPYFHFYINYTATAVVHFDPLGRLMPDPSYILFPLGYLSPWEAFVPNPGFSLPWKDPHPCLKGALSLRNLQRLLHRLVLEPLPDKKQRGGKKIYRDFLHHHDISMSPLPWLLPLPSIYHHLFFDTSTNSTISSTTILPPLPSYPSLSSTTVIVMVHHHNQHLFTIISIISTTNTTITIPSMILTISTLSFTVYMVICPFHLNHKAPKVLNFISHILC